MSKKETEIHVELSRTFKVERQGDEIDVSFIIMSEPTGKIASLCADLKGSFFSAMSKLPSENAEKDEKMDIQGRDILSMMYISGIDMGKVMISAKMLIKETGSAGGEKAMTSPMIDRMSPDDIEKCLGEYMANFILKSALLEMKAG